LKQVLVVISELCSTAFEVLDKRKDCHDDGTCNHPSSDSISKKWSNKEEQVPNDRNCYKCCHHDSEESKLVDVQDSGTIELLICRNSVF